YNGSTNDVIGGTVSGAGNTIADNNGAGIRIGETASDTGTVGIAVRRNSTFGNTGLGILLDGQSNPTTCGTGPSVGSDPNDNIPCPAIPSATTGLIKGAGLAGATVEVFIAAPGAGDSNHGEGKTFVGGATVGAGGTWSLTVSSGTL